MGLRWRIVSLLLFVSLLPLGIVGVGAWTVFGDHLKKLSLAHQKHMVQVHAAALNMFLDKRARALDLLMHTYSTERLFSQAGLEKAFAMLNSSFDSAFVDLGVITSDGRHRSYVGPFGLLDKNYSQAEWYQRVLSRGLFISDIFLGFRNMPHHIIALKHQDSNGTWILRATINSEKLETLVHAPDVGTIGDCFIVNGEGIYQTGSRRGKLLQRWPMPPPRYHPGLRENRATLDGKTVIQASTWINDARWMLVVQQDEDEILAPVRRSLTLWVMLLSLGVVLIVFTTFIATSHLTNLIDKANAEKDELARELVRSAKFASLGKMASGLAHEINNPLAIITAEQTNLADLLQGLPSPLPERQEIQESLNRCTGQVERCATIIGKMLRFGRHLESHPQPIAIGPRLEEIAKLVQHQAQTRNVELELHVSPDLPVLSIDPHELEQVMVNLITNSLHATPRGGRITITATLKEQEVQMDICDTGSGIRPEHLEHIFEPFFTTKPVGQGTGLGLSVCYGIIKNWGGRIEAKSTLGEGTILTVHLPLVRHRQEE